MTILYGKFHYKLPFSIAMLNNQRVLFFLFPSKRRCHFCRFQEQHQSLVLERLASFGGAIHDSGEAQKDFTMNVLTTWVERYVRIYIYIICNI